MIKTFIIYITLALSSYALFAQQAVNRVETFPPLFIQDTVYADSNTYSSLNIDSCDYYSVVGKPILPVRYVRILIPKGAKATGIVINGTSNPQNQTLSHKVCYGTLNMITGEQDSNSFDSVVYSQNTPFPSASVSIVNEGYFRGNCIVTVAVYPVVYIPAADSISYVSSIDFSLQYEIYPALKAEMEALPFDKDDRDLLGYMIDNKTDLLSFATLNQWTKSSGSMPIPVYCKYLIVTEEKYINAFAELMDWKRRKGVPTQAVAIEDILANYTGDIISGIYDDAGKLRQFLSDAYKYGGIEYALLAGENIPIRRATATPNLPSISNDIPTDVYFSDFNADWDVDSDGNYGELEDEIDFNTEIFIGRIMPRSKWEVENWVRKVQIYEKNPGNGDGSYLTKLFISEQDGMQQYKAAQNNYNNQIINWLTETTLFQEDNREDGYNTSYLPSFPRGSDVISEINNNYGIIGMLGHGAAFLISTASICDNQANCNDPNTQIVPSYFITSFDKDLIGQNEIGNGLDNLINYCNPSIAYVTSCKTMPFDNVSLPINTRNVGDAFTCAVKGGGPAYLGNTRNTYFNSIGPSNNYLGRLFFLQASQNNTFNIGKMESISKMHMWNHKLIVCSHNLMGCPETEIWTSTPKYFNNVTILENGTFLNVNLGIADPNGIIICVNSALDNGVSYYEVVKNSSSFSFSNIVKPYNITITKHNYLPYIKDPDNIFIQNMQWNNTRVITGDNFYIGSTVTTSIPTGSVIFNSGANIVLKPKYDVLILADFEVANGASFEVKTKGINDENKCL